MPLVVVLIFLFPVFAYAQVYKGAIDKYPIVFELSQDPYSSWKARYYYTNVKKDIQLYRDEEDTTILRTNPDENNMREEFLLKENGNKLTGKWRYKGKTLNVMLTQDFEIKCNYKFERFNELNKYSALKIEKINFVKTKEEKFDNTTTLTWYKEPVTGIECFRIKSSTKIKDVEKVNKFLREKHLEEICSAIECVDGAPYGGEYSVEYRISYLDNNLMSVVWGVGYYCGGAHPDGGENAFTMNHNTLQEIKLRDLYWLSNDPYTKINDDYDMPGFGEVWQKLLNAQFPGEYPADKEREESEDENMGCIYDSGVWSTYTWYLTTAGLYLSSFFPRVARCCDTGNGDPAVSYKLLEKYRVKKNKYVLK